MSSLTTRNFSLPAREFNGQSIQAMVLTSGEKGAEGFLSFFADMISNANSREAYRRAWCRLDTWCQPVNSVELSTVRPLHLAAYIEVLSEKLSAASVKQHRAALSKCFDFLVIRQIPFSNPVSNFVGPKLNCHKGKTPTLTDEEFLNLIDSIPDNTLIDFRDRAFHPLLYKLGR